MMFRKPIIENATRTVPRWLLSSLYRRCCGFSTTSTTTNGNEFEFDKICEMAASNLRFGPGATSEVGQDLAFRKSKKVIVVTDSNLSKLTPMTVLIDSLQKNAIDYVIYDQVRIEPNDQSFQHAIRFFTEINTYDAVVALGGGSVIDTAKAANLYATYPPIGGFYDYVNPPLGKGLPVPGNDLKPLIAIPTTAGTGSETTGVAIFDDTPSKSKTGIASRLLKPTLGIVDPDNTASMPARVATYSGLDVLCHAIESYTALPFDQRPKPSSPAYRPAYQGSNPISDV
jgi:hydroxyacid-oxoacid transhydrogenase